MRISALIPLLPLLAAAAPAPAKQELGFRPSLNFGPVIPASYESLPFVEESFKRSVSEPMEAGKQFIASRVGTEGVDYYIASDVSWSG